MTRNEALKVFSAGFVNFLKRGRFTLDEIGGILSCSKSNVSLMTKSKVSPTFETVMTLAENGMTLEEIFGAELAGKLISASKSGKPDSCGTPEEKADFVREGLVKLLAMMDGIAKKK